MVSRDLQVGRFTIKKLQPTKVGSVICQRTDYNRLTSHTQQTLTQVTPPSLEYISGTRYQSLRDMGNGVHFTGDVGT